VRTGRVLSLLAVLATVAPFAAPAHARLPPADPGAAGGPGPTAAAPAPAVLPTARSRAMGRPWRGRLVGGVQLPAFGEGYVTWDGVLKQVPSRPWRRWGTDTLVALVQRICAEFGIDHPSAALLLVGDLSRHSGGVFDERFGGLGHASHQNGLDVDVYYPRKDGVARAPWRPGQVDRRLAQDLVDRFVAAGAEKIFVGPRVRLRGPRRVVQPLVHHDDHLHVRIPRAAA
jgi:murein endopeptidase